MDSRLVIGLFIILILIETPILLLHEWNHFHPPPVHSYTIGPCGPISIVVDRLEIVQSQPPTDILNGIDCPEKHQAIGK